MSFDLIISNISREIRLTEPEIDFFLSLLETTAVSKKAYLLRCGDVCRYDYFVNSGCLKVGYHDEKGTEHIIKFAVEDWWVVDLDSFLHDKASFYFIQAIEDTTLFRISRANLILLHQRIPKFEKFSNTRWQNGFIALQQRIMQSLSLTAEERYLHFVEKYPNLELRISQKQIAAYLGISPEFLSVLRRKRAASIS